jgi:hypothetical protein
MRRRRGSLGATNPVWYTASYGDLAATLPGTLARVGGPKVARKGSSRQIDGNLAD